MDNEAAFRQGGSGGKERQRGRETTMDWYRIYHGLPDDPRLGVMAHRAGMSRAEGLALFVTLLDFASRACPRGSVAGFDAEGAAVALGIETGKVEAALAALRDRGMIDGSDMLSDWQRQKQSSTARVRRFRARRREAKDWRPRKPGLRGRENPDDPAVAQARRRRLQDAEAARMQTGAGDT